MKAYKIISIVVFVAIISGIILFCIAYCFINLQPAVSSQYILTCVEGKEQPNLLLNIAKLEGKVDVLQRMIPIYAGLLVAIVLFLTWTQAGIARSTAIDEINDNYKSYKDRIKKLTLEANDLTEKIKAKYKIINDLDEKYKSINDLDNVEFNFGDLVNSLKNKNDGNTN